MSKFLTLRDQTTEFLLYTAPSGAIKVEVLLSNESIWLTQKRMAELEAEKQCLVKALQEYNKYACAAECSSRNPNIPKSVSLT